MTTKRLVTLLVAAMAVTVTVAQSRRSVRSETPGRTFEGTAVVTAPVAEGRVMLAHDEIPGFMPAMTMPFAVGPAVPASLAPGDRVRFTLRVDGDASRVEAVVIEGHDAAVAAALATGAPVSQSRLRKGDVVPALSLTTQAGRPFTSGDLHGKVTALTFIFTRCPVPEFCPLMMRRFQQVQAALDAEPALQHVQLVSVTLDPAFDTPAVLEAYAAAMHADPNRWQFLTGTPAQVEQLTKAFAVHVERGGLVIDHTLATAVIDADGRIVELWRGNGWKVAEVVDVIRRETSPAGERAGGNR